MTWIYKASDGVEKSARDFREALKNDAAKVGTTTYTYGGKYGYSRFADNPSNDTGKLEHTATLTHKVFDVQPNTTKVTVAQGTELTDEYAKNAVANVGNEDLPDGTTYEWVNATGTKENPTTSVSGVQTFRVKVTLPPSQTDSDAPEATKKQPTKTIEVTVNVTPPKPTFDNTPVTSTSRTITGTLGGLNANSSNTVVSVALNDGTNRVLTSENNGGVTINGNTWTATLPNDVKLRTSVAKNGETTQPNGLTVTTKIKGATPADDISVVSDNKAVEMGDYSVSPTIAGSKHIDIRVPHDAKRVELRFHNNQETGDKPNSILLVRGTDGWHTEATRADNTSVTDANGYVGTITSTPSTTNPSENNIRIALNEQSGTAKLHIKEENANGDNTDSYNKGLGLRVYTQPDVGQTPTATGKWKVANVTNTAPTINVKGDTGKDATHRKVYDSGTTLTADLLKDLVTVTDAEDSVTPDENKPFGTGNVKIISQIPAANGTGTTSAGLYEVTLAAVDSQGKEGSQVKVYVAVKEEKPSAPSVEQWQNGNVKVTPDSTNSGGKITIPLKSGSVVVTKDSQNGWQVTGQPNGVSVHDGSIEIPRNLVNTTVTATASKGEGDVEAVSNKGTHILTTHEVTKVEIVKKPTESIAKPDLSGTTGVTGVRDNNVEKTYENSGIRDVDFKNEVPTLTPNSTQEVPVTITYNDGSKEADKVTLKVTPAAPNVTVNEQDGKTGDVTLTIKRHDNSNYPDDSVVTVPGIDGTFKVKNGIITIKNEQLKDKVQKGKVTVTEITKLLAETAEDKEIPAKLKDAETAIVIGKQDKESGEVTFRVNKDVTNVYPDGTKVKITGVDGEYTVANGTIKVPNDKLPGIEGTNTSVTVTENGHKPATTTTNVPGKLTSAKGEPAREFEVTIPLPTVVPNPDNLRPEEKTELEKKVKKSNPNMDVKVDDNGNVTITDPKTGQSKVIPVKDLTVKDFEPVKPIEKVPVKDKAHLTPEEKKQVADKVTDKNPGKEVTVGEDGTATVTDPTTGISHKIPGTDLVNQDFTPVKPTEKVSVKDKAHLTSEEKKQVADKVKEKNPGKEVTVGDDGTVTVTDPTTGISHTIPGTDLVNQDFEPVKPTEKVPVKDKAHLTPEEKKQVVDKVKEKNPGKEVTVGEDGTATVTDPTTGISHTIPGTDLVNQDFTPVKPTEKVPVKDKAHLTQEEKKQVADKVKEKNPGKEVIVGDDGTVTVTDPITGISHTFPGTDLVNQDFEPVKPTEKVPVKDKAHLTPEEKKQVADKVKAKNPGKEVTVGEDGTATVKDPDTGITHTIPGSDLVNQDFTPVKPTDKVPVKDLNNLSKDEQDKVKESVEKANPGKTVVVEPTGKVTITDPNTNISHELSGEEVTSILPPVLELPEYTDPIGTTGVDGNGNLILPPIVDLPQLIITKWMDEQGNELKPADAKAPAKIGEANEAYEHGEISGYVFVKTETEGDVVTHIFRKVSSHDTTSLHEDNNYEEQPSHEAPVVPIQSTNDTSEVRTPVEPTTEENHSTVKSHASQTVLPNTGTAGNAGIFSAAASMLAGLGFLIPFGKRRKKEDEEA